MEGAEGLTGGVWPTSELYGRTSEDCRAREKTDNKFTERGKRDPPYQDPCRVPAPASARPHQLLNLAFAHLRGRGPYYCKIVYHSASNKLDRTIVTAVGKVDNCVSGRSYSSLDYYKLTAVSKE